MTKYMLLTDDEGCSGPAELSDEDILLLKLQGIDVITEEQYEDYIYQQMEQRDFEEDMRRMEQYNSGEW